jgi:hypothetical protein
MKRVNNRAVIEAAIRENYLMYAGDVVSYAEMQRLAKTDHGRDHWAFKERREKKMGDDFLGILYAFRSAGTLQAIIDEVKALVKERAGLIDWLADQPRTTDETADHIERANCEIAAFANFAKDVLFTARHECTGDLMHEALTLRRTPILKLVGYKQ